MEWCVNTHRNTTTVRSPRPLLFPPSIHPNLAPKGLHKSFYTQEMFLLSFLLFRLIVARFKGVDGRRKLGVDAVAHLP